MERYLFLLFLLLQSVVGNAQYLMLEQPLNDKVLVEKNTISFLWYCDYQHVNYEFVVSGDSLIQNVLHRDTLTGNTLQLNTLADNKTYYWQVKAFDTTQVLSKKRGYFHTLNINQMDSVFAWFDPDTGVVLNGQNLAQWKSRVDSSVQVFQPVVSSQPTTSTSPEINQKTTFTFDGNPPPNTDFLHFNQDFTSERFSVISIGKKTTSSSRLIFLGDSANTNSVYQNWVDGRILYHGGTGSYYSFDNGNIMDYNMQMLDYNGTRLLFQSFDTLNVDSAFSSPSSTFNLIGLKGNGERMRGEITEMILVKDSLPFQHRLSISKYLEQKYAPQVYIGESQFYCTDTSIQLTVNSNFNEVNWSTGDTTDTIHVSTNNKYWARAKNYFGKWSTDTIVINGIRPDPDLISQLDTTICLYDTITLNSGVNSSFQHNWTTGSTNTAIKVHQPGDYSVMVTDTFGCVDFSDTVTVKIDSFKTRASLGPNQSLCSGNRIQLIQGDEGATAYSWSTGDTTSSIEITSTGQYSLTATNDLGCVAHDTIDVSVKGQAPTVNFTFTNPCDGQAASFTDQSIPNSGNLAQWKWYFGDGDSSTVQHPAHLYSSDGPYEVSLIATTDSGCSATGSDTVLVRPNPVAGFSWGLSCENLQTQFTSQSSISSGFLQSHIWDFGDGNTGNSANTVHVFDSTSVYGVQLITQSAFGCTDSVTKQVFVKPSPVAAFSHTPPCLGDSVAFTENATGDSLVSFQWALWNGTTVPGGAFSHVFQASGSYAVKLTATDSNSCIDTVTGQVSIRPHPAVLNQQNDSIICAGDTLTWHVPYNTADYTFNWSTGTTDSIIYISQPGKYAYAITDSVGCSSRSDTAEIKLNNYPHNASIGKDTSICKAEMVPQTSGIASTVQIAWSTGDSTTAISIDTTGHYSATMTDTMGCHALDTILVTIKGEAAEIRIGHDTTCISDSTHFHDKSVLAPGDSIVGWNWDFGNGLTGLTQNPTTYYPSTGPYNVSLTGITNDGCISTGYDTIEVYSLPSPAFTTGQSCEDRSTQFTDQSTAVDGNITTRLWHFGDSLNSSDTGKTTEFTYQKSASVIVTLMVGTNYGCSNQTGNNLNVQPTPVAGIDASDVCLGNSTLFSTNSKYNNPVLFHWNFGDSLQSQGISVQHQYDGADKYDVVHIVENANGCRDTATTAVNVFPNPTARIYAGTICQGAATTITDISNAPGYAIAKRQWRINGPVVDTTRSFKTVFQDTGTVSLSLSIESQVGCTDSISENHKVRLKPTAGFAMNPAFGAAPLEVALQNTSSGQLTNRWLVNDSIFSENENTKITFDGNGVYTIELVVNSAFSCRDTAERALNVVNPVLDLALGNVSFRQLDQRFAAVSVSVQNTGTRSVDYFEVLAQAGSNNPVKQIFNEHIEPGETRQYDLSGTIDLSSEDGFNIVCAEVMNPEQEGTDDNRLNNRNCTSTESFFLTDLYPNPANNKVRIEFVTDRAGETEVKIFNNKGKQQMQVTGGTSNAGYNLLEIDVSTLPIGLYHVSVTHNQATETRSFVVSR